MRSDAGRRSRLLETHTASAVVAPRMLANQVHARAIQRIDHLGQGPHDPAHVAVAGFHPLDRRQRDPREVRQCLLINAKQRPGRPHLE